MHKIKKQIAFLFLFVLPGFTVIYAQVTQEWFVRYGGPGNGSDHASSMEVDISGNVYVTGGSSGTGEDFTTIKYNSSGVQQWVQRCNVPPQYRYSLGFCNYQL